MNIDEKVLKVSIKLGQQSDSWNAQGDDTLVAEGFRVSCQINYGNGSPLPSAKIKIFGLPLDVMMKLLRVRWNTEQAMQNMVQVEAGTHDNLRVIFTGNITFAYPDFTAMPEVCLNIESHTAVLWQLKPAEPVSHEGEADVATVIRQLTEKMGRKFENNGVNVKISNTYLDGTELAKIQKIAAHADIDVYVDNDTIAIAPKGQPRSTDIPLLRPDTGLIGYPIPDLQGVQLRCLYDTALKFGGLIEISGSQIEQCNGRWRVFGMMLDLESQVPNGKWFAEIKASNVENGADDVKIAK